MATKSPEQLFKSFNFLNDQIYSSEYAYNIAVMM